jgi:hypothetical protein
VAVDPESIAVVSTVFPMRREVWANPINGTMVAYTQNYDSANLARGNAMARYGKAAGKSVKSAMQ